MAGPASVPPWVAALQSTSSSRASFRRLGVSCSPTSLTASQRPARGQASGGCRSSALQRSFRATSSAAWLAGPHLGWSGPRGSMRPLPSRVAGPRHLCLVPGGNGLLWHLCLVPGVRAHGLRPRQAPQAPGAGTPLREHCHRLLLHRLRAPVLVVEVACEALRHVSDLRGDLHAVRRREEQARGLDGHCRGDAGHPVRGTTLRRLGQRLGRPRGDHRPHGALRIPLSGDAGVPQWIVLSGSA